MEILLSMYPFTNMDILSFNDYGLNGDSWWIRTCKLILFNPKMNNIQVIFNSIQNIDSFNYDSTEYMITQKLEKLCEYCNLLEVSDALKELSKFYENNSNAKAEKSLLSKEKEI